VSHARYWPNTLLAIKTKLPAKNIDTLIFSYLNFSHENKYSSY
jgi:hypothetical protein